MTIREALGIPAEQKHIVSIVGGGGKTTLLYALASESCRVAPTAVFTTTHIMLPQREDVTLLEPFSAEVCRALWTDGRIAAAGKLCDEAGKLTLPDMDARNFLLREAQAVYIEADGSKRLPLKFPAEHEPVILPETTLTVVVGGLSALEMNAENGIHRLSLARRVMDIPNGNISADTMARLLWTGYGRYDPVFLLNQADTPIRRERAEMAADILKALGAKRVVITALLPSCQNREFMIR